MKPAKLTGSAAALAVTSMLAVAPLAFAEDAKPSSTPNTPRLATVQAAEEKPAETLDGDQPADEETPEPIEVVPVPTASPTEAPQPTEEPSPEPSETAEPTPTPGEDETPEPIEVVPVPTATPTEEPSEQPSEPAEPTPEPVESETAPAEPSESENAPVPVEAITPTSSAPVEVAAPEASAEVVPVQVDAEQNILLTGTVTQEQTTETGETVVVTEEVTAAGEHVTTEFVVNPAEGQTTVTQTVTNPATGEKKTTERKVPATTFKAGGAASIEAAPATDRKNAAPLLLGVVGATGVSLAAAGIILYRRQATTAS